jgi:rare lipoprotein A
MWRMVALAAMALALAGCAHRQRPALVIPVKVGHVETGIASWYGKPYDGRASASGEIYDMEAMVAAHKTMPFQTWVRVYNLSNQKSVDVRIIDRGPFVKHRIIDLSHAAALAIDMVGPGVAKVRLVVIKPEDVVAAAPRPAVTSTASASRLPAAPIPARVTPPPATPPPVATPSPALTAPSTPIAPTIPAPAAPAPSTSPSTTPGIYSVQIGVFPNKEGANRLRDRFGSDFGVVQVIHRNSDPEFWRVYVGAESSEDAANALADRIREKSDEKNAFVVRLDLQ